jgi:hypothetical protein
MTRAPRSGAGQNEIQRRCGGIAATEELLTGIEGASSRPGRRIVLLG